MKKSAVLLTCFLLFGYTGFGQPRLQPGFDAAEYLSLLDVFALQHDSTLDQSRYATLAGYQLQYTSPDGPLKNRVDVWQRPDGVGIICIRGTVSAPTSWLENFYSAMIPANCCLQVNDSTVFRYQLAADSNARVHVGWTLGLSYLAPLVVQQVNRLYASGTRAFIIMGHSQGGVLAFLLRSYLYYHPAIPKDILFKTYASAAPKPGDLKYAYDLDFITRGGWCLRVVNSEDWVPETPLAVQTLEDLNEANPFSDASTLMNGQKWYVRWYINSMFRKMKRSSNRAMKRYQHFLGKKLYGQVKKAVPGFAEPAYSNSVAYMPAGQPVILLADTAYKRQFQFTGKNVFVHHVLRPYRFLVNAIYGKQ